MADSPTSQAHSRAADLCIRWGFHTVRASIPPSLSARIGWMNIGGMGRRAEPPHVLAVTPRTGNHHPAWVGWFQKLWVEHGALPGEPVPHTPRSRCMPSQKALRHFCQRENQSLLPRRKRERISRRKMSPESGRSASSPSLSKERRALLAVETQPHPVDVHVLADGASLGNRDNCKHSSATVRGYGRNSRAISKGPSEGTLQSRACYTTPHFRARIRQLEPGHVPHGNDL